MGVAKLNVWVRNEKCEVVKDRAHMHVYDCQGKHVLGQAITGHTEVALAPGCYIVTAGLYTGHGNVYTDKTMVVVGCDEKACVNLVLNRFREDKKQKLLHPVAAGCAVRIVAPLYINAKKIIENERKKRSHLSKGDISVIVFGKCLEIYSKYYPNITSNGEPVSVDTATDKVWEIIEQLSETDYLPPELDPITRAFTLNLFEPGGISYNELNKRLRQRGIDISELDAEQLISGPKNAKRPADPFSRKNYIEGKLGKDGDILDIDKVQYLFILYTTDKNPSEWLRKWKTPELEQLCKILAEKTGDSRYANVMELTLDMF